MMGLLLLVAIASSGYSYDKLRNRQGITSITENDVVTNTTYTNMVIDACIANDGTNEVFVDFFGTATSSDIEIKAGEKWCFNNLGTYTISTICSTGETTPIRIITLEDDQP